MQKSCKIVHEQHAVQQTPKRPPNGRKREPSKSKGPFQEPNGVLKHLTILKKGFQAFFDWPKAAPKKTLRAKLTGVPTLTLYIKSILLGSGQRSGIIFSHILSENTIHSFRPVSFWQHYARDV